MILTYLFRQRWQYFRLSLCHCYRTYFLQVPVRGEDTLRILSYADSDRSTNVGRVNIKLSGTEERNLFEKVQIYKARDRIQESKDVYSRCATAT